MNVSDKPYQFVGILPYVDRAAEVLGLRNDSMKGKAKRIEHLARIQTALGQTTQANQDERRAIFSQALTYRESLAVALLAAELAIVEVANSMGLDSPQFAELDLELAAAHQPASR